MYKHSLEMLKFSSELDSLNFIVRTITYYFFVLSTNLGGLIFLLIMRHIL